MPVSKAHLGLVVVLAATIGACAPRRPAEPTRRAVTALRVAVPPDAPPYAYRQREGLAGLEVDFAGELAAALGRPLVLVPIAFDELISALLAGRADIAMAGMTITPAREVRIAFSDPYLRSGLLAVMRREDASRYPRPQSVLDATGTIGVVTGTTGERFVRERTRLASVSVYPTAQAAVTELGQRRVDLVVHDAPVGIWFVSGDEAHLAALLSLLDEEQLGWGMRRDDEALRAEVNRVLARWRTDGTRDRVLARWLPYWKRLEGAQ
jgi:polar amino acid transport system substrate-binding protein